MNSEQEHNELIEALRAVLRDDSLDSPLLIKRVPFICSDIKNIKENIGLTNIAIQEIRTSLEKKFVTKETFWPVKTLVYGAVGIMLTAVIVAGIALIIQK